MVNLKNKKYIIILICSFSLLVAVEYLLPKPISWRRSYSKDDKIPYGNYILYTLLPSIFPQQSIQDNYRTLYEQSEEEKNTWKDKNFVFINEKFAPDELDTRALLNAANSGANIFIAAHTIDGLLADTLGIEINSSLFTSFNEKVDSVKLTFVNSTLSSNKGYGYLQTSVPAYFKSADSLYTTILGYRLSTNHEIKQAVFIRIKHGNGAFYLHTVPLAFTNYNMIAKNNEQYIAKAFSYLPNRPLIWDEFYKMGRREAQTPMRFILSQEALKWAWFLLLGTVLLFVLFRAKRQQRIIPIVKPPHNASLEFTQTIGRLYFQHQDHKNLAEKKIAYFLEYLRTHFYIDTRHLTEEFIDKITNKSGFPKEKIKELFRFIDSIQNSNQISEQELQKLSDRIEGFYKYINKG